MSKFVFLLLLLALHFFSYAENKPVSGPMREDAWEELRKDLDYSEEKTPQRNATGNFNLGLNGQVVKYFFFFAVFGILIYFLVRYLIALQSNAATTEEMRVDVHTLAEAEENLLNVNLGKLLAKLIAEGNYRGATRTYYLLLLQQLHARGNIVWAKPKTNFDYVRELAAQPFQADFSTLTYQFELVWYGQKAVDEANFSRLEKRFTTLLSTLKAHEK